MPKTTPPNPVGGRKLGARNVVSVATLSRQVAQSIAETHALLGGADGTRWWAWFAKKYPREFAEHSVALALKSQIDPNAAGVVFQVVQINSTNPQPVPGVLTSPIAGHVAPQRPAPLQLVERSS